MMIRFTDQAQKAMLLAEEEARRIHHEYVGTEHVLLGLVKEVDGLASKVLLNLGIELLDIREEVLNIVSYGPEQPIEDKLPLTPRAQTVIRYAMDESHNLHRTQVGTAELLLGVLRETDGIGSQVLENLGVIPEILRKRILDLLVQGLDDTVSKETFDKRILAEENTFQRLDREERMRRTKITVSVIPVKTARVDDHSMEDTAGLAQLWHREYVAKYGHPWSDDWDEQLALSLQGENGPALQAGINEKWYPWWKRLLQTLVSDGVFQTPDCPEKWQIRE
jgi:hypothetical protein